MLRREFRPMVTLAAPVVMAELGWVAMGLVDTLMVGRLGADAIGAVGLGSMLFIAVAVFAMGLLLGLDPLVAQAYGAKQLGECHRWLVDGLWLSGLIALPLVGVTLGIAAMLPFWGLPPGVLPLTQPYLGILAWSLPPLLLYVAFRRYLQALGIVTPVMVALIAANGVNIVVNWVLIFGRFGAPALGVRGAAYATLLSRVFMAAFLFIVIVRREAHTVPRLSDTPFGFNGARLRRLIGLGFPAAGQTVLEVGVFAAATALAGRVSAGALAAHQIALNMAAVTFMVPFGLASAAAVRVGQAVGRRDPDGVRSAGWTAILIGVGFMSAAATVFLVVPGTLIRAFTNDTEVIRTGVRLLLVAAAFQLFDGLQGVTTGVLRGLADTRTPMLWNLAGHWFLGLPLGYVLCFPASRGFVGLWWGLSTGLMVCGVALLIVWVKKRGQPPLF
jgi:MATE family multidrug resistance protein